LSSLSWGLINEASYSRGDDIRTREHDDDGGDGFIFSHLLPTFASCRPFLSPSFLPAFTFFLRVCVLQIQLAKAEQLSRALR
jgi:hypothetical protein